MKTKPFPFQEKNLEAHGADYVHAWFWEPGTGKSKQFLDNLDLLWQSGEVAGGFLVAPNGLHRNMVMKEAPKHLDDAFTSMYWRTDKSTTKTQKEAFAKLLAKKGPTLFAMSYDGLMTEEGRQAAKTYLQTRRCLYALDESQRIKEGSSARTKRVLASADFAPYRRIMTGTPVGNRPWDVHSQIKFLDPNFWRQHGLDSIESMKAAFGEWEKRGVARMPLAQGKAQGRRLFAYYEREGVPEELRTTFRPMGDFALKEVPVPVKNEAEQPIYKNLAQLRAMLDPIRSRVLKKDALPDLPDQLYSTLEFEMTPAQWRAYRDLEEQGVALIDSQQCSVSLALTMLLRLQQIACGYLVCDIQAGHDEPEVRAFDPNPRIRMMLEITEDLPHQALIWARFRDDITQIVLALQDQGKTVARYDGAINDEHCAENEDAFHRGDIQFLVMNQDKGGEGLTLTEAQTVIHYSNPFKLLSRLQCEARPHRPGQHNAVNNIDLVARGTVDEKIVHNLINKFDMASIVNGDNARSWLKL